MYSRLSVHCSQYITILASVKNSHLLLITITQAGEILQTRHCTCHSVCLKIGLTKRNTICNILHSPNSQDLIKHFLTYTYFGKTKYRYWALFFCNTLICSVPSSLQSDCLSLSLCFLCRVFIWHCFSSLSLCIDMLEF